MKTGDQMVPALKMWIHILMITAGEMSFTLPQEITATRARGTIMWWGNWVHGSTRHLEPSNETYEAVQKVAIRMKRLYPDLAFGFEFTCKQQLFLTITNQL